MKLNEGRTNPVSHEFLQQASEEFDRWCTERHERGAEEYGPTNFLEVDTLVMAMEEVADLANYARYTFIKLYILQKYATGEPEQSSTGVMKDNEFVPTGEVWKQT
jgi:hypothetical protein